MDPLPVFSDEEIVKLVVFGSIPSYLLESKLGDCYRVASIRRKALQRFTGRSLWSTNFKSLFTVLERKRKMMGVVL
ncbi:hypothetical protein HYC85_016219 [Camellia sinensis]|uniref:Uncharacterized protein n=1 Tax=Camellia sinensis TaxID=4442 RepID=A0A7J7H127_CAMSI|nr:hypothetical protein HYC85_016219 [Camellia sinensis]